MKKLKTLADFNTKEKIIILTTKIRSSKSSTKVSRTLQKRHHTVAKHQNHIFFLWKTIVITKRLIKAKVVWLIRAVLLLIVNKRFALKTLNTSRSNPQAIETMHSSINFYRWPKDKRKDSSRHIRWCSPIKLTNHCTRPKIWLLKSWGKLRTLFPKTSNTWVQVPQKLLIFTK